MKDRARVRRRGWIGLCLLAWVGSGHAQDDEHAARAAALASIRAEIGRLTERLDAMRAKERTLEDRLAATEVELRLQEQQLVEASEALALAVEETRATDARVSDLEVRLTAVGQDLRRRVGGLYRVGRYGYLRLLLRLEANQGLLPAIRQLRYLARRDRDAVARFHEARDTLERERVILAARKQEIEVWQGEEETRHRALAASRRRQADLLARVGRERKMIATRTQTLVDKAQKLSTLLRSLAHQEAPLAGTSAQDFEGVLDWPLHGTVAVPFGPRRDPRYKTEVPHNGIAIDAKPGEAVRAVYPGEVVFAGTFEGYGRMVVVHHPGRVFTLYAGLATLGVQKGDVLSLNAVLGVSAETLYFEVRRENRPENPLRWLR